MEEEIPTDDYLHSYQYKKGYKKGYSDAIHNVFVILRNHQKDQERSLIDLLNNTLVKIDQDKS